MTRRQWNLTTRSALGLALAVPLTGCSQNNPPTGAAPVAPLVHPKARPMTPAMAGLIDGLLAKTPAPTAADQAKISQEFATLGAPAIGHLCDMLTPPDKGGDVAVRYALHDLAMYVSRPGADADRLVYSRALAEALANDAPAVVKSFILEQLRLTGGPEIVPSLAPLLADPDLCEPATLVLLTVHSADVPPIFRSALASATGANRITILKALGDLRDHDAVPIFLKDAASADRAVRLAALYALANSADPAAVPALAKAAAVEPAYERSQATKFYLLLAARLSETGQKPAAVKICRDLYAQRAQEPNIQCATLNQLATTLSQDAMDDLIAGMANSNSQVKAVATGLALGVPGQAVTRQWIDRLKTADAPAKAQILSMLAQRGDRLALAPAIAAIKDSDVAVRRAAIASAATLGGTDALAPILDAIDAGGPPEHAAARDALTLMKGDAVDPAIVARLTSSAPPAKTVLLRLLGSRNATEHRDIVLAATTDPADAVRIAAFDAMASLADGAILPTLIQRLNTSTSSAERDAAEKAVGASASRAGDPTRTATTVIAAMDKSTGPARAALLRTLGKIGGKTALGAVRSSLQDSDPAIQDAAVRTLADWPDADAAEDLLYVARSSGSQSHQVLAIRGYVRLADRSRRQPATALTMLRNALQVSQRPDEKKLVLASLSEVKTLDALKLTQDLLADEALQPEAAATIAKITDDNFRKLHPAEAMAALQGVILKVKDPAAAKPAQDILDALDQLRDYILDWQVSGPYMIAGRTGLDLAAIPFPPENASAADVKWEKIPAPRGTWEIDFSAMPIKGDDRVAYLRTFIWSPTAQKVQLQTGSDDGLKIWLNGEQVFAFNAARGNNPGEDKIDAALKEGWNTLLLKVNNGAGGWAANARVRTPEGKKLDGLKYSAEAP